MKYYLNAKEAPSGVITYVYDGVEKKDYPNNNLLIAYKCYEEYMEWRKYYNIQDYIDKNGINWEKTSCNYLVWEVFLPYIQHKELCNELVKKNIKMSFSTKGRFGRMLENILPIYYNYFSNIITFILNITVVVKNTIVAMFDKNDLIFIELEEDFRMNLLEKDLLENKIKYTCFTKGTKQGFLKTLFKKKYYFIFEYKTVPLFSGGVCSNEKGNFIYEQAQKIANNFIKHKIKQYKLLKKLIKIMCRKTLVFGCDDVKYSYPIIYAFQDANVCTVGLQHGAYNKVLFDLTTNMDNSFRWFDKIIVWGSYWKDVLINNGNKLSSEFLLGSNKHNYIYNAKKLKNNKSVIFFYEQWASMNMIGKYVKQFIKCDFIVYFKVRPDVDVLGQLESLMIDDASISKINVLETINASTISEIDLVAGFGTSIIYELMLFGKIVWILDIEQNYIYLQELIDLGYARLVSFRDLDKLNIMYQEDLENSTVHDYSIFDYGKNNAKVLIEIIDKEKERNIK